MANKKQHIKPDYDVLLRKYMDGSISKEQQFVLERAALDNPFLADALEGFHASGADHSASLQRINREVESQSVPQTRSTYPLRRIMTIAASLLLVGIIGFLVVNDRNEVQLASTDLVEETVETSSDRMAINENVVDKDKVEISEPVSESTSAMDAKKSEKDKIVLPKKENKSSKKKSRPIDNKRLEEKKQPKPSSMIGAQKSSIEPSSTARSMQALPPTLDADQVVEETMESESEDLLNHEIPIKEMKNTTSLVEGTVYSADRELLVGALINISDMDTAVTTDINGTFSFEPTNLPIQVDASYMGFNNKSKLIDKFGPTVIVLDEAQTLSEIVVTEDNALPNPVMGMKNFEEFIKDNKFTSVEESKELRGSVMVGFVITPDGSLANIRVLSTDCMACKQRAIQLLELSGKWENATDEDINATYNIHF